MSRIPKLQTIADSKENRPLNRVITRTIGNGLSNLDKKNLILNHARPLLKAPTARADVAPRLKRETTVPGPSVPAKHKVEKKSTVAPKIPLHVYKARFHDLLQKHKAMKSEFNDLKDKHGELGQDYERLTNTVHSRTSERDMINEKLLNTLKHVIEALHHKTKFLEEVTNQLKQRTSELDLVRSSLTDLTRRHRNLRKENEANHENLKLEIEDLRFLSDQLKGIYMEYDSTA